MKKLCLAVGIIAVLSAVLAIALAPRAARLSEPEYDGRKLTAWLEDEHDSGIPDIDPASAIRRMGTNAVPFLVQMLQANDSPFKRKCMDLLSRQHWVHFHILYDFQKRSLALQGLGILGPDAKAAIPDLANLLSTGNQDVDTDTVLLALSEIGPDAVPVLGKALTNSNSAVRWHAAQALGSMAVPSSVPWLLAALKHPDPHTRLCAARALARFPRQADVIVPALLNCVDDPDSGVRANVAGSLGNFGGYARPAFPKLLTMVADANETVSDNATYALMHIDLGGTLAAFTNNLESPDVNVRRTTAWALMHFSSNGEPAAPFLVKCLKDPDPAVRKNAAIALSGIASDPDLVVPALMANLSDTNADVREDAAVALRSYGERARAAVPQILKIIEENKGNDVETGAFYDALDAIDPGAAIKLNEK
ncbi:MAG TPA: HEAT repeat domain-containing protein [Candidatus Sulfotelmatobacter sp.]|nr:HEAT repeat domain-containing protein [Candidatus Sulfotelmatobacter sp.]